MRILINSDPYLQAANVWTRGVWPAKWVHCPGLSQSPQVTAYRLVFDVDAATTVRIHVTADEQYELFLDGQPIGRGPERGGLDHWYFETYDLPLSTGRHTLVARTWALGPGVAPAAQLSIRPGFLLGAEGTWLAKLATGHAAWEVKPLGGYSFDPAARSGLAGKKTVLDGRQADWGHEAGQGSGWQPVVIGVAGHTAACVAGAEPTQVLTWAVLPAMRDEPADNGKVRHLEQLSHSQPQTVRIEATNHRPTEGNTWQAMLDGRSALTIPPNTCWRAIIDLGVYHSVYPAVVTSGGRDSTIRMHFAESLYRLPKPPSGGGEIPKGQRDQIEGNYFQGVGPRFILDGGAERIYRPLWWEAGRYIELLVQTADQPLTLHRLLLRHTGYPFDISADLQCSDQRLSQFRQIAVRTMQVDTHETYMDCPYYEQLMYVGDSRLEALTTYTLTADDRLQRKAIELFNLSRDSSGLTQSRYPSIYRQVIPPFSLFWIGMVHDWAFWRDDLRLVRRMLPGIRAVLDAFEGFTNDDGLLEAPRGWNFVDWVPGWDAGMPPGADKGVSVILNWHLVQTLEMAGQLEGMCGAPEMAAWCAQRASEIAGALEPLFDQDRGLYPDAPAGQSFSEHAQCMALLTSQLSEERRRRLVSGLLADSTLARTTIYFSHYLLEVLTQVGRMDVFFERLNLWLALPATGLTTTPESPEPTRSDCHAWGTHPLYHYYASVLGIRPATAGFASVRITPQLGPLTYAHGTMPHPRGLIHVEFNAALGGQVTLPDGLSGELIRPDGTLMLRPGINRL